MESEVDFSLENDGRKNNLENDGRENNLENDGRENNTRKKGEKEKFRGNTSHFPRHSELVLPSNYFLGRGIILARIQEILYTPIIRL